jgi:hypothetical protein
MIERVETGARFGLVIALVASGVFACADAHDVDAVGSSLRRDGGDEGSGSADDEDDEGDPGDEGGEDDGAGRGSSGSGAAGGDSGNAGRAGSGGSGQGNAGNGGGTGEPEFDDVSSCAPCMGAEGTMGALEPCCTADGECGLDIGALNGLGPTCARQNAPGTESTSCPDYVFQGNYMLTSCCGADGVCGVMIVQTAPLGCVDPALLGDLVMPAGTAMTSGGGMFGGGMRRGGQDDDEPARCSGPGPD